MNVEQKSPTLMFPNPVANEGVMLEVLYDGKLLEISFGGKDFSLTRKEALALLAELPRMINQMPA